MQYGLQVSFCRGRILKESFCWKFWKFVGQLLKIHLVFFFFFFFLSPLSHARHAPRSRYNQRSAVMTSLFKAFVLFSFFLLQPSYWPFTNCRLGSFIFNGQYNSNLLIEQISTWKCTPNFIRNSILFTQLIVWPDNFINCYLNFKKLVFSYLMFSFFCIIH